MKPYCSPIERLEPRIAPASLNAAGTVLTYTDIDGDLVKVTFTKATMDASDFTFSNGSVNGDVTAKQKLVTVDLTGKNGASMALVATSQKIGGFFEGDSHANVKIISAVATNLVSVKVDGDVQAISAVELQSFSALSFGAGYDDNGLSISQLSTVGTFAVKGDIAGRVSLTVAGM